MKPEKINNDKKVVSKRKFDILPNNASIYSFNSLENYYDFENFIKLHRAPLLYKLKKASSLYLLARYLFFNNSRF